jgi:hypothetical protein
MGDRVAKANEYPSRNEIFDFTHYQEQFGCPTFFYF